MSEHFWLTEAQMDRLRPFFPRSRGKPRVDDRRVLSGIIYVKKNGLQWKDAPGVYGPPKTLYNRFVRWSRLKSLTQSMFGPGTRNCRFTLSNGHGADLSGIVVLGGLPLIMP